MNGIFNYMNVDECCWRKRKKFTWFQLKTKKNFSQKEENKKEILLRKSHLNSSIERNEKWIEKLKKCYAKFKTQSDLPLNLNSFLFGKWQMDYIFIYTHMLYMYIKSFIYENSSPIHLLCAPEKCESNEWRIELFPKKVENYSLALPPNRSQQTRQSRQTNSAETIGVGIGNGGLSKSPIPHIAR